MSPQFCIPLKLRKNINLTQKGQQRGPATIQNIHGNMSMMWQKVMHSDVQDDL